MRIRRMLFDLLLHIAKRDRISAVDLAWMCGTSRPRATVLLQGRIDLVNSETLIDMLLRVGVVLDVTIVERRPYRRHELPRPRFPFVEPWRTGFTDSSSKPA